MSGAPPENDLIELTRIQRDQIERLSRENARLRAERNAFESHALRMQGELDQLRRDRSCLPS